jgi:hypothetical protein
VGEEIFSELVNEAKSCNSDEWIPISDRLLRTMASKKDIVQEWRVLT